MNRIVQLRSARDGTTISLSNFVPENGSPTSESFLVSISNYELKAETRASSYMAPNLHQYFASMASEWQGWKGEKTWATLEGEFELKATVDSTGHVRLAYFLRPPYTDFHWELRGAIEIEVGQLEAIAAEFQAAWPA